TEAFPHLLLMAFLQRVTNGDGRGRTDLAIQYRDRCYLIIFDRRPEAARLPWSEKIKWEHAGEDVTVLGC
ncbi:MAG: hypothetical protein LBW77_06175, partial [Verrucomicrobiota bacterium]|nr:hypothetical protein [Verrucomicrobiota bacterium]